MSWMDKYGPSRPERSTVRLDHDKNSLLAMGGIITGYRTLVPDGLEVFLLRCQPLVPVARRANKCAEERPRCEVASDGALGVPLHAQHEMIGCRAFDRFGDTVVRTPCYGAQAVAGHGRRLMMTGVDGDAWRRALCNGSRAVQNRRQPGVGR